MNQLLNAKDSIPIERVPVDQLPTWMTVRDVERHLQIGRSRAYRIVRTFGVKVGATWRLNSSRIPEIARAA